MTGQFRRDGDEPDLSQRIQRQHIVQCCGGRKVGLCAQPARTDVRTFEVHAQDTGATFYGPIYVGRHSAQRSFNLVARRRHRGGQQ